MFVKEDKKGQHYYSFIFSIYPKVKIGREVKQAAMLMYEKSLETLSSVSYQNT